MDAYAEIVRSLRERLDAVEARVAVLEKERQKEEKITEEENWG
jgi:BMFP domain-containing protein YqiC